MASPPADTPTMGPNVGARVLLVVAFLAASAGYWSWIASRTAFDTGATRALAHSLITTPAVQRNLADELLREVDREVAAAGVDPRTVDARARAAAEQAVRDPRVGAAFADAVAQVHAALLTNGSSTVQLDDRALDAAVHDALARTDPRLATVFAQQAAGMPFAVSIGSDRLPHLAGARDTVHTVGVLALGAALLLGAASLVLCHDRPAVRRAGRRLAYIGVGPLLVFAVLPRVLDAFGGDVPQIASAVLAAYGGRILLSAVVLIVAGIAVVGGSYAWPRTGATASAPGPAPEPRHYVAADEPVTERLYL